MVRIPYVEREFRRHETGTLVTIVTAVSGENAMRFAPAVGAVAQLASVADPGEVPLPGVPA